MWILRAIVLFCIRLYRYLFPYEKWRPVPRRLINVYEMRGATEAERILMIAGVARSPLDARLLMAKYNTDNPHVVLDLLPKRRRPGFKHYLRNLLRRFEGHDTSNPYEVLKSDKYKLKVRYKLKLRDNGKANN